MPEREADALLLESDHDYFAAGAEEVSFPGGTMLRMPGLEQVPAGCVAMPAPGLAPEAFVADAARCAAALGGAVLRFYTPRLDDAREALLSAGLSRTVELGFVATAGELDVAGIGAARVHSVRDDEDWKRKLQVAAALEHLPDGKQAAAHAWTELERRKCDAGYMDAFLIELDGDYCGAFGIASAGRLLRLKNLAVHPDYRGLGLGRAAVSHAARYARDAGFEWVGAYALADSDGHRLYERCGFTLVTEQIEWTRALPLSDDRSSQTLSKSA